VLHHGLALLASHPPYRSQKEQLDGCAGVERRMTGFETTMLPTSCAETQSPFGLRSVSDTGTSGIVLRKCHSAVVFLLSVTAEKQFKGASAHRNTRRDNTLLAYLPTQEKRNDVVS
jgi:hypothetical protein